MIFFGTSTFSIHVLEKLKSYGIMPDVIVTVPDRPAGRKLLMTSPPVKIWAEQHSIKCLQFEKLDTDAVKVLESAEGSESGDVDAISARPDIFIVASYGKIIPQDVLDIPLHGCLNVHPSLLPLLRGATPLQTSILQNMQDTGVTIIKMDVKMDHGPIVAVYEEKIKPWPMNIIDLEKRLAEKGADLIAEILPSYIAGDAKLIEQKHDDATFTKKITKEDGLIEIDKQNITNKDLVLTGDIAYEIYLKYQALSTWPGLYFFIDDMRVKIKEVEWNTDDSTLSIIKVIPEGKNEMSWKDFAHYIAISN